MKHSNMWWILFALSIRADCVVSVSDWCNEDILGETCTPEVSGVRTGVVLDAGFFDITFPEPACLANMSTTNGLRSGFYFLSNSSAAAQPFASVCNPNVLTSSTAMGMILPIDSSCLLPLAWSSRVEVGFRTYLHMILCATNIERWGDWIPASLMEQKECGLHAKIWEAWVNAHVPNMFVEDDFDAFESPFWRWVGEHTSSYWDMEAYLLQSCRSVVVELTAASTIEEGLNATIDIPIVTFESQAFRVPNTAHLGVRVEYGSHPKPSIEEWRFCYFGPNRWNDRPCTNSTMITGPPKLFHHRPFHIRGRLSPIHESIEAVITISRFVSGDIGVDIEERWIEIDAEDGTRYIVVRGIAALPTTSVPYTLEVGMIQRHESRRLAGDPPILVTSQQKLVLYESESTFESYYRTIDDRRTTLPTSAYEADLDGEPRFLHSLQTWVVEVRSPKPLHPPYRPFPKRTLVLSGGRCVVTDLVDRTLVEAASDIRSCRENGTHTLLLIVGLVSEKVVESMFLHDTHPNLPSLVPPEAPIQTHTGSQIDEQGASRGKGRSPRFPDSPPPKTNHVRGDPNSGEPRKKTASGGTRDRQMRWCVLTLGLLGPVCLVVYRAKRSNSLETNKGGSRGIPHFYRIPSKPKKGWFARHF